MLRNRQQIFLRLGIYGALLVFSAAALFPLYFAGVTSFKTKAEYLDNQLAPAKQATLDNYEYSLTLAKLPVFLKNNAIVVPAALLFYLFVCSAAGFAFGSLRFAWRLPTFLIVLFLMIFPQMVLGIQIYRIVAQLGLVNSHLGVVIVWVAYFAPFGTYIMTTFFSGVPREILESARMEGARILRILWSVMIPIGAPMMATISIIGFNAMWNELPFSLLLLQTRELRTFIQGIAMMQGEYGLSTPILASALILAAIIPLLVFLFFQRYIRLGAHAGSVKG